MNHLKFHARCMPTNKCFIEYDRPANVVITDAPSMDVDTLVLSDAPTVPDVWLRIRPSRSLSFATL